MQLVSRRKKIKGKKLLQNEQEHYIYIKRKKQMREELDLPEVPEVRKGEYQKTEKAPTTSTFALYRKPRN